MSCIETKLRVLIVGYGNPLRGDDAVGWLAAERLEQSLLSTASSPVNAGEDASHSCGHCFREGVLEIVTAHQLLPELAEPVSRAELAIFIDACCDQAAGQVIFRGVTPKENPEAFSHGMDPAALLTLAKSTFGRSAKAMLFTVGAQSFEHGAALSADVEAGLAEVVQSVEDLVTGWLSDEGHCHGCEESDCA